VRREKPILGANNLEIGEGSGTLDKSFLRAFQTYSNKLPLVMQKYFYSCSISTGYKATSQRISHPNT